MARNRAILVVLAVLGTVTLAVGCLGAVLLFRFLPEARRGPEVTEVRDEDYRFRIAIPGPGWRLLPRDEAAALNPYANAGAMHAESGALGIVICERAEGAALSTLEASIVASLAVVPITRAPAQTVSFHGMQARRLSLAADVEGTPFEYEILLFIHQDFLYQLFFTARPGGAVAKADEFFAAVSLERGEVRARSTRIEVADQAGRGWRIVASRLESGAHGIVVDGSAPFALIEPYELATTDGFAEAGLTLDQDVFVIVGPESVRGTDVAAYAADVRAQLLVDVERAGTVTHLVAGREVAFDGFRVENPLPFHHRLGVVELDDRIVRVEAWARSAERVDAALPDALARIRILEGAERAALATEIEAQPDSAVSAGDDWSIRGGTYRDFRRGITWAAPSRSWRVYGGDTARRRYVDALIAIEEPRLGVFGMLSFEPRATPDLASAHRDGLIGLGVAVDHGGVRETRPVRVGTAPGLRTDARVDGELPFEHEFLTANAPVGTVKLTLWYVGEPRAEARAAMAAAADALEIASQPSRAASLAGTRWTDERFGWELASPWRASVPTDITPDGIRQNGAIVQVSSGGRLVLVIAMNVPGAADASARLASEMILERTGGANPFATSEETRTTLGGRPATARFVRTLTEEVGVVTHTNGATAWCVLVVQPRASARPLSEIVAGFRFLDGA